MPTIIELSFSVYLSMPRIKTNLVRGDLGSLETQTDFGGISLKLFRFISIMMRVVQGYSLDTLLALFIFHET